jgi:hypothetical protein
MSQVGAGRAGYRLQLGRVEVADQAAQRLGDRRERHALLAERHAAAAQHPHALLVRSVGQPVGQPRLADPPFPADHGDQRLALDGMREQLAQQRQLLGAANEAPGHDLVGHDASMPI